MGRTLRSNANSDKAHPGVTNESENLSLDAISTPQTNTAMAQATHAKTRKFTSKTNSDTKKVLRSSTSSSNLPTKQEIIARRTGALKQHRKRAKHDVGATESLMGPATKFVLPVNSHTGRPRPRPQPQPIFKPTTITTLTYERSVEITRISITALISMITFFKKAFGDSHIFEHRYFDPTDPTLNYDSFKKGSYKVNQRPGDPEILNHWLITAGKSAAADKLLSWLEHDTVRAAIEGKYLAAIELRLHYRDIIESYFIIVKYNEGDEHPRIEAQLNCSGGDTSTMVVYEAQAQLYDLMEKVNRQLQQNIKVRDGDQNSGPSQITMGVTLNDRAPQNLYISGFERSLYPSIALNNQQTINTSTMQTPFHCVSVYPPGLESQDIDTSQQVTATPFSDTQFPASDQAVVDSTDEMVASPCTLRMQGSDTASVLSEDYPQTQVENVALIRDLGPFRNRDATTQDTMVLSHSVYSPVNFVGPNPSNSLRRDNNYIYKFKTAGSAENTHHKIVDTDGNADEDDLDVFPLSTFDVVCECGASDRVSGNMMKCFSCCNYQHFFCYGHLFPPQANTKRLCYSCFNNKREDADMIHRLCLIRRAIYALRDREGLALGEVLNFMVEEEGQRISVNKFGTFLMSTLKNLGIVKHIPFLSIGEFAFFSLSSTDEQLHGTFFDPALEPTALIHKNPQFEKLFSGQTLRHTSHTIDSSTTLLNKDNSSTMRGENTTTNSQHFPLSHQSAISTAINDLSAEYHNKSGK